jgi:hypothetical protein
MKSIIGVVTSFDAIGAEYGFDVRGNPRHSTWYSMCCSFILYLVSALVLIKLVMDYFDWKNPNLSSNFLIASTYPKFDLYEKGIIYAILLED